MNLQRTSRQPKAMGIVRIFFGIVWAIDAWYKWQPGFLNTLPHYMSRHLPGQPPLLEAWLTLWVNVVNINPHLMAYLVALGETAIAIGLLLGLFNNLTYIAGIVLSFLIWSTAEGFGGPPKVGSTDIGTSIIYTFVFVCLLLSAASRYYSLDNYLRARLKRSASLSSNESKSELSGSPA